MINLGHDLYINADSNQYILGTIKLGVDKHGNTVTNMVNPSYHTSMESALKSAVERLLRQGVSDGTIDNLKSYMEQQYKLQKEFAKLVGWVPLEVSE